MYLYIVRSDNNLMKIGVSGQPDNRLRELQSSNAATLSVVYLKSYKYAGSIEAALHWRLRDWHVRGEWFRITDESRFILNEYLETELDWTSVVPLPKSRNMSIHNHKYHNTEDRWAKILI